MPELPAPSAEGAAHSVRVRDRIRAEIESHDRWIPFTRYMELALYEPGLGYYAAGAIRFGTGGDFVTAPEISPLFARSLARFMAPILRETAPEIVELGAGSGRLARDLLGELAVLGVVPQRYRIVEVSADLRTSQRGVLRGLSEPGGQVEWLDALPDTISGIVFGNEVLDALPVSLVRWEEDALFERGVAWKDDALVFVDRPLVSGRLFDAARAVRVPPGYVSEVSLAVPALVRTLAERLVHGLMLWIDYGFSASEYYHPQRSTGTLMCHYRHRAHADPFFLPGLQDITAHVDFSAVADAGQSMQLDLLGYAAQAQFLIDAGITDLLSETPADDAPRYLPLAAGAQKLLSPTEMGELFKVMALGRGLKGPIAGFGGRRVSSGSPPR